MTNVEFMYAVIADLWEKGQKTIDSSDPAFHEAMGHAIQAIGRKELHARGVQLYFDPITRTVGELYHMSSLLQSFGLAQRPNPTFAKLTLTLDKESSLALKQGLSDQDLILVDSFASLVRKHETCVNA